MSYRSDVRISTTLKGFKELKKFVKKYIKEHDSEHEKYNLMNELDINYQSKEKNYCYFGWEAKKWYEFTDEYVEVRAIMEGLEHLKEMNLPYGYARIGEDYDDYEEDVFESTNDKEELVSTPCMWRVFNDGYEEQLCSDNLKYRIITNNDGELCSEEIQSSKALELDEICKKRYVKLLNTYDGLKDCELDEECVSNDNSYAMFCTIDYCMGHEYIYHISVKVERI